MNYRGAALRGSGSNASSTPQTPSVDSTPRAAPSRRAQELDHVIEVDERCRQFAEYLGLNSTERNGWQCSERLLDATNTAQADWALSLYPRALIHATVSGADKHTQLFHVTNKRGRFPETLQQTYHRRLPTPESKPVRYANPTYPNRPPETRVVTYKTNPARLSRKDKEELKQRLEDMNIIAQHFLGRIVHVAPPPPQVNRSLLTRNQRARRSTV